MRVLKNLGLKRLMLLAMIVLAVSLISFAAAVFQTGRVLNEASLADRKLSERRQGVEAQEVRLSDSTSKILGEYAALGGAYRSSLDELQSRGFAVLNLVMLLAAEESNTIKYLHKSIKSDAIPAEIQSQIKVKRKALLSDGLGESELSNALSKYRDNLLIDQIINELESREAKAIIYVEQLQQAAELDAATGKKIAKFSKKLKSSRKALKKGYLKYDKSDHRLSARVNRFETTQTERITFLMNKIAGPAQRNVKAVLEKADTLAEVTSRLAQREKVIGTERTEMRQRIRAMAEQTRTVESERESALRVAQWVIAGFIAMLVLLAIIGVWVFRSVVIQRVLDMREAMSGISHQGDLEHRLPVDGKDEFGSIATDFNAFVANIKSVVERIQKGIGQIETAGTELSEVSSDSSGGAQRLEESVGQMNLGLGDLRTSVEAVTGEAGETSTAAESAANLTRDGGGVAEQCQRASRQVSDAAVRVVDQIGKVARMSVGIHSVLDLIQEIADQTNMLALNAAIEAARAGEQGRGFAVVADEVRNLAQKTRDATNEIESKLTGLVNEAEGAEKEMTQMAEISRESGEAADSVKQILDNIISEVHRIVQLNAQVVAATQSQSGTLAQFDKSLEVVSDAMSSTNRGVDRTRGIVGNLESLLETLEETVSRFKSEATDARPD